ncbi:MAG: heat-shock protein [Isosphaeraceae bacterium]|nr:MAG: heat-shock protein [Isosphaeraceae bacterium]
MARSRYIVGIDLGTTNCAVAYVDTRGRERPAADLKIFEVPQLVAAGETAPRTMLPSFLYLPGPYELPAEACRLPWREDADRIVGEFARIQGARVPGHLVASAKSWLCHGGVDREAEILPWGAPAGSRRVSPVEASAEYLRHIREAWDYSFARADPAHRLERQEVVLTVPASFDEAARELTIEAARRAGLPRVTLLEEPQAAFYCWIVTHEQRWQEELRAGELILVCDIGGGTTDFSLITVVETPTGPGFRRVAVGDHLMLGGDNMDLALAHRVEAKLGGVRLDTEQWSALRFACRTAKEQLLREDPAGPERWPVTIAGRGSRLVGGSVQAELTREEVREVVLDGFYPAAGWDEEPKRGGRAGLQEFGLPFVSDPGITRHLAAFLRRHGASLPASSSADGGRASARPEAILFNGGALTPSVVRERLVGIVADWYRGVGEWRPRVLVNPSLDLAVALGAAYYGVVRRGGGIRIGGGTARAIYVGVEPAREHTAGTPWLCVVPRDAEEGDELLIADRDFELLMGQPVAFPLASSSVRAGDRPGDLVPDDPETIRPLPPLVGIMKVSRKAKAERVPVRLEARVTEVGTVELWCHSRVDDRRWRLQIQIRGPERRAIEATGGESDVVVLEQELVDRAVERIREAFGPAGGTAEVGPARLVKALEAALELPKDRWPTSALRALWEPLREVSEARSLSAEHETRWLNLAGYCLRPGTGYPLDETRIKALWPTWHVGLKHPKQMQCWVEWWVLWRRVAAGLNRAYQEEVYRRLAVFLVPAKGTSPAKKAGRPRPEPHELSEMWRCAASLERIDPALKVGLGDALARELARPAAAGHVLWCLGRLGARVPLYGPANTVVPTEAAERWIAAVLGYTPGNAREAADQGFALGQLARMAGDRARDVGEETRAAVLARLEQLGADAGLIGPVREIAEMTAGQRNVAFGDALPVGLRLASREE